MAELELLSLDLKSPIAYAGMENPPLSGAPMSGRVALPSAAGGLVEAGLGEDLEEGEEELFLFEEDELVRFDPDEGPLLRRPLPRPAFYGRRSGRGPAAEGRGEGAPGSVATIGAGAYVFLQWRPADQAELMDGLEWFAKESWWERSGARGPYMLRRVREDGGLATQALRRLR